MYIETHVYQESPGSSEGAVVCATHEHHHVTTMIQVQVMYKGVGNKRTYTPDQYAVFLWLLSFGSEILENASQTHCDVASQVYASWLDGKGEFVEGSPIS